MDIWKILLDLMSSKKVLQFRITKPFDDRFGILLYTDLHTHKYFEFWHEEDLLEFLEDEGLLKILPLDK